MMTSNIRSAFFGTSHVAVYVLEELKAAGLKPLLVVTMPDRPRGRGMEMTAPPAKIWAVENGTPCIQPEGDHAHLLENLRMLALDCAAVCDYGAILKKDVLEIPKKGFLNVHPSLLPRLRGASPMRSAILTNEQQHGVTVMLMDEKMDHGPIIAQKHVPIDHWPPHLYEFERTLMIEGGKLLARVMPLWIKGEIEAHEQNHDVATYCGKIQKEDGELNLSADPYQNLLKIRAYEGWPGTFTFFEKAGKKVRVKILDAHLENGALKIERVIPEGKREMTYEEFLRSGARPI